MEGKTNSDKGYDDGRRSKYVDYCKSLRRWLGPDEDEEDE